MGVQEFLRWQWSDYSATHRSRVNWLIHIFAVPLPGDRRPPGPESDDRPGVHPTYVKEYAALGDAAVEALRRFADDVRAGRHPGPEHSY